MTESVAAEVGRRTFRTIVRIVLSALSVGAFLGFFAGRCANGF